MHGPTALNSMSCDSVSGLLVLPLELRDAIYDYVVPYNQVDVIARIEPGREFRSQLSHILTLAHTTRELRYEVLSYLRRRKKWIFWGGDAVQRCKELPQVIAKVIRSAAFSALTVWTHEDSLHAHKCQVQGLSEMLEICTRLRQIDVEVDHHCLGSTNGMAIAPVFELASTQSPPVKLRFSWNDDAGDDEELLSFFGCSDEKHRDAVMSRLRVAANLHDLHLV